MTRCECAGVSFEEIARRLREEGLSLEEACGRTGCGGTCTACHGQDAKGTAVAPDLTDNQWINGDGSYDFIVHTVTTGVPQPKQHPAPMPPKGGAALSDQQVKAVAAYVYSLSHKS